MSYQNQQQQQPPLAAPATIKVMSRDKTSLFTIPAALIEPTLGFMRYQAEPDKKAISMNAFKFHLCAQHSVETGRCVYGPLCSFIHSMHTVNPALAHMITEVHVHICSSLPSLADAQHPTHPYGGGETGSAGSTLLVLDDAIQLTKTVMEAGCLYITQGSQAAYREAQSFLARGVGIGTAVRTQLLMQQKAAVASAAANARGARMVGGKTTTPGEVTQCTHFIRGWCARGAACHFGHPVLVQGLFVTTREEAAASLAPPPPADRGSGGGAPPPPSPLLAPVGIDGDEPPPPARGPSHSARCDVSGRSRLRLLPAAPAAAQQQLLHHANPAAPPPLQGLATPASTAAAAAIGEENLFQQLQQQMRRASAAPATGVWPHHPSSLLLLAPPPCWPSVRFFCLASGDLPVDGSPTDMDRAWNKQRGLPNSADATEGNITPQNSTVNDEEAAASGAVADDAAEEAGPVFAVRGSHGDSYRVLQELLHSRATAAAATPAPARVILHNGVAYVGSYK